MQPAPRGPPTHPGFPGPWGSSRSLLGVSSELQWAWPAGAPGPDEAQAPPSSQFPRGAPGRVDFREERMLAKSLQERTSEGLWAAPRALRLTGNPASPGAVGLQPHFVSCWKGCARRAPGPTLLPLRPAGCWACSKEPPFRGPWGAPPLAAIA